MDKYLYLLFFINKRINSFILYVRERICGILNELLQMFTNINSLERQMKKKKKVNMAMTLNNVVFTNNMFCLISLSV